MTKTTRGIAEALNVRGIRTARGGGAAHAERKSAGQGMAPGREIPAKVALKLPTPTFWRTWLALRHR
jgi:hypothetical protein